MRRSWSLFGWSVAGCGFALCGVSILYICLRQQIDWIGPLLFLAGVPFIIIGIRVAGEDKTDKAVMQSVDPNLYYRYFLTFRGGEEEIKEFGKIERAFDAFRTNKEAWSIRIEPPIGGLSEWKCYYDKKMNYVTEITLVKKDGEQRWRQFCEELAVNHIKRLKNIIVNKKKTDLMFTGKL